MSDELNLMISGLSGQGIVMVGRILATALLADGKNVFITDSPAITHKNATTYTQLRIGDDIHSLKIGEKGADLLLAMEPNEGLKVGLVYAKDDALVVLNDRAYRAEGKLAPVDTLKRAGIKNVKLFPASDLAANEMGRLITLNMVMLGAGIATGMIPVQASTVEEMIRRFAPKNAVDINVEAFKLGMSRYREMAGSAN